MTNPKSALAEFEAELAEKALDYVGQADGTYSHMVAVALYEAGYRAALESTSVQGLVEALRSCYEESRSETEDMGMSLDEIQSIARTALANFAAAKGAV